jgi:DNA replication and repair protein RecF
LLIRNLRVKYWRNLRDEQLEPGERVTVLFGRNGQGKSNLLEAAYYALTFRSFRTSSVVDVVMWGQEAAEIQMGLIVRGISRELGVRLGGAKKVTTLDGKNVRRDADSLDGVGVVVFGPEDLRLPKGGAAERRRALDRAVFSVHRCYYREALAYERALKGRNGLLRSGRASGALLESYDETLAVTGARIVIRRRALVAELAPRVARVFEEIHGEIAAEIRYRSKAEIEAAKDEHELRGAIRNGLEESRSLDQRRGFTGFGPQTDDLAMLLGGRLAKEHGSQGQIRSLVLAFKLAELTTVAEQNREMPVLLLDDVASELDEKRRARLFDSLSTMACQTLLTVTEPTLLPRLPGRTDWHVGEGHLTRG